MLPVLTGLVLSVPLTMLTSRTSAGRWTRRRGLLLTPEETDPPPEIAALERLMAPGGDPAVHVTDDDSGSTRTKVLTIRATPEIHNVPTRMPLPMEAVPLVYLRPRDALVRLQRMVSAG
jgi:membrane glycosyltransferase